MKTKKLEYTEVFQDVYDDGYKQIYIRKFGHVILDNLGNDKKVIILCIAEIYDLDGSHAVPKEEIETMSEGKGCVQVSFSLLPEEKYISKQYKNSANSHNQSMSGNTIVNVQSYCGGLRFDPDLQVWFKTNKEAEEYLLSKEVNDQISALGSLSGFTMDQHYNRIGETNWDILNKIMNGK